MTKAVRIVDKHNCSGCGYCKAVCPKQCISFHADWEGSWYPKVDTSKCIDCGLCEQRCPISHPESKDASDATQYFAAYFKNDEIRYNLSSSGGIFYPLAKRTIDKGGVVFGARFDGLDVIHDYSETLEGVMRFMGSKYVQSDIRDSYKEVKRFLSEGRDVLFSGTLCQTAALRRYLNKDYENLLTVAIMCHGVPSVGIWKRYVTDMVRNRKIAHIYSLKFRHKEPDWESYNFFHVEGCSLDGKPISFTEHTSKNAYFSAYFNNLIMRPSCYGCKYRHAYQLNDFTIGDHWNWQETASEMNDHKGLSSMMVHTAKGKRILSELNEQFAVKELDVKLMDERMAEQALRIGTEPCNRKLLIVLSYFIPLRKLWFLIGKPDVPMSNIIIRKLRKIFHLR